MEKLKVLELFAGIGACSKALKNLGIPIEIVDAVEINNKAIISYNAIHNTNFEVQDITKWDKDIDVDLICGGFPCQDISSAGKQKGIIKGETRSGLMYEMMRIIEKLKPKYVITENVKALLTPKFEPQFNEYINFLKSLGYSVSYKLTNASYYGIPQERERVIIVAIRDEEPFVFDEEIEQSKDLEKYIIFREEDDLTLNFYNRFEKMFSGVCDMGMFVNYINKLPIRKGIGTKKMGLYKFNEMDTITMPYGTTGTLTCRNVQHYNKKFWFNNKIYKPSPLMCWRLMGFSDEDYNKASQVCSEKDLYNQAGNSIVVNVLQCIFKKLFNI